MTRSGLLFGLAAYGWWGLMPFYFEWVIDVPPPEMLAHRIVWSFLLLALVLSVTRRWGEVKRCLTAPRVRRLLLITTVLIAINWLAYIYSITSHQVVVASLGYFILPLINVLLGTVLLGERLRPLQWLAVALASCGVVWLLAQRGELPWLAFGIAISFGLYGLLRKRVGVDGLVGLTVETLLLLPVSAAFLLWRTWMGSGVLGTLGPGLDVALVLSGLVTTVPLLCFAEAARRLPLTTLGFLQYLSPTLQLLLAVTRLGEDFGLERQVGFGFIWAGLAVFSVATIRPSAITREGRGQATLV